ncbi:MAG TPA: AI-2E family transporter [Geminicoccaceae bacterium]|nr:AI-2E family transporter [Geminicoccaceae bacterium]
MIVSENRIEQYAVIAALALLAAGCIIVLLPFASSLLWAFILAFSTWPIYGRLQQALGDRRTLGALLMTLLLATALVLPLVLVGQSLAENAAELIDLVRNSLRQGLPDLPGWLVQLPFVGAWIQLTWWEIGTNTGRLGELVHPYLGAIRDVAVAGGLSIGRGILELSLSVLATFFFYRDGIHGAAQLQAVGERLMGARARRLIKVAGDTIQSVVYGVIGTAIVQGILAAIGFWIAGFGGPFFLGFVTFVLGLIPMGPPMVWIPATLWLFAQGQVGAGIFLAVWGAFVISGIDNFLRPILISRGSNLPLFLVFLGAIGGALAFGFLGLFLGPTLLSVGYALVREWSITKVVASGPAA